MRKAIHLFLMLSVIFYSSANAQRKVALKWAPTGLLMGDVSIAGEFKLILHSTLNVNIGIPVQQTYSAKFSGKNASFGLKTTSLLAGYRMYLSKKSMKGFYFEPYLKYVHFTGTGSGTSNLNGQNVNMAFASDYKGTGVGIQFGHQFMIAKRVVIDFYFIGAELNSSNVSFSSTDMTSTGAWNNTQASQAQQNVQDFVSKIPIIGNKITITTDANNRTVTANYKGILPGFRAGLAIGIIL